MSKDMIDDEEPVAKLLKHISLRNDYTVYEDGGSYLVAGENRRGQRYECKVWREAVSYLRERMKGRRITAEQACYALEPVAERFRLPYTYGDKPRYSGQYVLVVAVALDQATIAKEGLSRIYSIK